MKPIKMFGLAALAALMAMAFVGASSAMASSTALCATEGATCASPVTHVHETSVGKAKLLSSFPTIECNVLFLGEVAEGLASPVVINGIFTYFSCNNFCSVSEVAGTEAKVEVLKEVGFELASVTYEREVHFTCPFINCVYNGEGLEGDARGPLNSPASANGSVAISGQEMNRVSGSCPEPMILDITTTPLSATYLSA